MSDFKFALNREGVRPLLKSGEMKSIMEEKARGIVGRASVGYTTDSYMGKTRVNAMVYPDSLYAYFSNLKHNILLKVMK